MIWTTRKKNKIQAKSCHSSLVRARPFCSHFCHTNKRKSCPQSFEISRIFSLLKTTIIGGWLVLTGVHCEFVKNRFEGIEEESKENLIKFWGQRIKTILPWRVLYEQAFFVCFVNIFHLDEESVQQIPFFSKGCLSILLCSKRKIQSSGNCKQNCSLIYKQKAFWRPGTCVCKHKSQGLFWIVFCFPRISLPAGKQIVFNCLPRPFQGNFCLFVCLVLNHGESQQEPREPKQNTGSRFPSWNGKNLCSLICDLISFFLFSGSRFGCLSFKRVEDWFKKGFMLDVQSSTNLTLNLKGSVETWKSEGFNLFSTNSIKLTLWKNWKLSNRKPRRIVVESSRFVFSFCKLKFSL